MRKRIVLLILPLAMVFSVAKAETVGFNQVMTITGPDSVCRSVANQSPTRLSLFVPTQTVGEWQSFYNNPPAGVQLNSCVAPPPTPPPTQSFNVNNATACTGGYCACGGPLGTKACGDLSYTASWICASRGFANVVSVTTQTLSSSAYACSPTLSGCWSAPPGCHICDVVTCGN